MTATNNIVKPCRVKDFVPTPKMDKGEAQRELRELLERIEVFEINDSNWEEWEKLWDRKRVLRSVLNIHNI